MLNGIFWICLAVVLYIYLGYPLCVILLSLLINKKIDRRRIYPKVTIVIPAYNEEECIRATIENKLSLDYPEEQREIIVVSDGSTDGTDKIVTEIGESKVRLIHQEPRMGKTLALNKAVQESTGEIIVFSDANSLYDRDSLMHLVSNFSDESVGYVTGKMVYMKADGNSMGEGCSAYMKYENFVRNAETRLGSIVGVDGGIDAVRKHLYEPMKPDHLPDFILPLKVVEKGYRVIFDDRAVIREESLIDSKDEYRMRVRVSIRALNAIREMKHIMNPMKRGLFAWQFLSHKMLRYSAFIFLILVYLSNFALLINRNYYIYSFLIQNLFYLGAFLGWYFERRNKNPGFLYIPFYFCLLNIASAQSFILMLMGERKVVWEPRRG